MTNPSLIYSVYKKDTEERRAFTRDSFDVLKTIGGASFVLGAGYLGFANDNPNIKNAIPGVRNLTNFMNSSGRKDNNPLPTRKIGKAIRDRAITDYQARNALAKEKAKEVTLNLFDEMSTVSAKDKLDEILAAKENQRITHLSVILDMINDPELNVDDESKAKLISKIRGAIEDSSRMSDADKADISSFLDSVRSNKTLEEKYVSLHQKNSNVAHLISTSSRRANNGANVNITNPFETFSAQNNKNQIYHKQNLTASNLQDDQLWTIFGGKSDEVKNTVLNRFSKINDHLRLGNNNPNFNVTFDIIKEANEDAYGVYARINSTHSRSSKQPLIVPLMAAQGKDGKYVRLSSNYSNAKVVHNHYFDATDFSRISTGANLTEKQQIAREIFNKKMPQSSFEDFAINLLKSYSAEDLHYMNQAERNSFMEVLSGLTQYYPTHGQMNFGYTGIHQKHGIQMMSNTAYFFNRTAAGVNTGKFPVDLNELVSLNIGIFGPSQGQAGTIRKELKSTNFEQQAVIIDPNILSGKSGSSNAVVPFNIARTHGIKDQSLLPGSARIAQLFGKQEAMIGFLPQNTVFQNYDEMQSYISTHSFGRTGSVKTVGTSGKDLLVVGKEFEGLPLVGSNTGVIIDFNEKKKGQRFGLADAMQYRGGKHLIAEPLQKTFQYTQGMTNLSLYESDVFQKILGGEEVSLFGEELESFFKSYGDKDGNLVLGFKDNMATVIKKQKGMMGLRLKRNSNVNSEKGGLFSIAGEVYGSHEGKIFSEAVKGVFFGDEQILDVGGMKNVIAQALVKKDPVTGKFINKDTAMNEASQFLEQTYLKTFGGRIENTMLAGMDVVTKGPQYISSLLYGSLKMLGYEDSFIESNIFNMQGKLEAASMDTKVKQHAPKYQKIIAENIIETFSNLIASNAELPTIPGAATQQVTPEILGNLLIPAYHNLKEPASEPGKKAVAFKDQLKGLLTNTKLTIEQQKIVQETAERGLFIGAMSTFAGTQSTINKDRMARVEPRFANFVMGNLMGMFQMSEDEASQYMAELFSKQSGVAEKAQAMTPLLLMGQSFNPKMDAGALKHSIDDFVGQGYLFKADDEFIKNFLRANVDVDSATTMSQFLKQQQEANPDAMGFIMDVQKMFLRGVEGNENINTSAYSSFLNAIGSDKTDIIVPLSNVLDIVSGVEIKTDQKDLKIESELYRKVNDIFAFIRESAVATNETDQTAKINQAMYHVNKLQKMIGTTNRQILSGRMSGSATIEGKGVRLGDPDKDQVTRFVSDDLENTKILQKMNAAFIEANGYNMYIDTQAFMYAAKTFNEQQPGERRELFKKFLLGMEEHALDIQNGQMKIVDTLQEGTFKPQGITGIEFRNPQLGMSHIGLNVGMFKYAGENLSESHFSDVLRYSGRGQSFLYSLEKFMGNEDFREKISKNGGNSFLDFIDTNIKSANDRNDPFSFLNFKTLNVLNQLNKKTSIFKDSKFDFMQTQKEYLEQKKNRIASNILALEQRIEQKKIQYRNNLKPVERILDDKNITKYENLNERIQKKIYFSKNIKERLNRLRKASGEKREYVEELKKQRQGMIKNIDNKGYVYKRINKDTGVEEEVDRLGKGFMNYYKQKSQRIKDIRGSKRIRLSASRSISKDLNFALNNLIPDLQIGQYNNYFVTDFDDENDPVIRQFPKKDGFKNLPNKEKLKYGRQYLGGKGYSLTYSEAVVQNLKELDFRGNQLKLLLTQSKRSETRLKNLEKQKNFQEGISYLFGGTITEIKEEIPVLYTHGKEKGNPMLDRHGHPIMKEETKKKKNVHIFHPDFLKAEEELVKSADFDMDAFKSLRISEFNKALNLESTASLLSSEEAEYFFKKKSTNLNLFDFLFEIDEKDLNKTELEQFPEDQRGRARLTSKFDAFIDLLDEDSQKLFYEHDGNDFLKDEKGNKVKKIITFDNREKEVTRQGKTGEYKKIYSGFDYIKYNIENINENFELIEYPDPKDPSKNIKKYHSEQNKQFIANGRSIFNFMKDYIKNIDESGYGSSIDIDSNPLYKSFFKIFNFNDMNQRIINLNKNIFGIESAYSWFGGPERAQIQLKDNLERFTKKSIEYKKSLKENFNLNYPTPFFEKNNNDELEKNLGKILGMQAEGLQENKVIKTTTDLLELSNLSAYFTHAKHEIATLFAEKGFLIPEIEPGTKMKEEDFVKYSEPINLDPLYEMRYDENGKLIPFSKYYRQEKKKQINQLFEFINVLLDSERGQVGDKTFKYLGKLESILDEQKEKYSEAITLEKAKGSKADEKLIQELELRKGLIDFFDPNAKENKGAAKFLRSILQYSKSMVPKMLDIKEQEWLEERKKYLSSFFSDQFQYSVVDDEGKFVREISDSDEDKALLNAFQDNFKQNPEQTTFGKISATRLIKNFGELTEDQQDFYNENLKENIELDLKKKQEEALSKVKINKGYELGADGKPDKTKPIYYDESKKYTSLEELDKDISKYESEQRKEYKEKQLKKNLERQNKEEEKLENMGKKGYELEKKSASLDDSITTLKSSHLSKTMASGGEFIEQASDFDRLDENKNVVKGFLRDLDLDEEGNIKLDSEGKPIYKEAVDEHGNPIAKRSVKNLFGKLGFQLGYEDFAEEQEIDLTKFNKVTNQNELVYKTTYDESTKTHIPTTETEKVKVKKVNRDLLKNFVRTFNYLHETSKVTPDGSKTQLQIEKEILEKVRSNENNILAEVQSYENGDSNRFLFKPLDVKGKQHLNAQDKIQKLESFIAQHNLEIQEINSQLLNPTLGEEEKQFHTLDDIINEAVDLYSENYSRSVGLGAGRGVYPEFETTFQFQNAKDPKSGFDIKVRTDLSRAAVGDFDGDIYQIILNNEKTSNAFKGQIQRNVREMQKTGAMMVVNMEIAKKAMSKVAERMDVANISYQDLLKSESSKERILKAGTGSVDVAVKKVAVGAAYNLTKGNLSLSEFRKTDLAAQLLISASQESVVIKSKSLDLATNIGEEFTRTLNQAFQSGDTAEFESFMRNTVFKDTEFLNDLIVKNVSVENMPEPLASAYTEGLNKERITFNFDDIFEGLRNIIKTVNDQNLSPYASDNMLGALMSSGGGKRFSNEDYLKLVRNFDVLEAAVGSQGLSTPEQQALFENLLGAKQSNVMNMISDNIAGMSNMKMTTATAAVVGASYLLSSSYDTEELRPEEIFTDTRVNEKIRNRELAQVQNYNSDVSISPDSMQRPFYKDMIGRVQSPGKTMLARNQSYLIKGNVRNIEEANYMNKIALQNGGSSSIMVNDNRKPLTGGYLDQLMGE